MAASSGSFDGEIGKKQPGPIYAPEPEDDAEETAAEGGDGIKGTLLSGAMDAAKTNVGGGLLSAAKTKATEMALRNSGFTTGALAEFEPADRSPNWFVVILLVVMVGVMFTV